MLNIKKKVRNTQFGSSVIIYDEIFSNLINLIEDIAKLSSFESSPKIISKKNKIYSYIKEVCEYYLDFFKVKVEEVKKNFNEFYF